MKALFSLSTDFDHFRQIDSFHSAKPSCPSEITGVTGVVFLHSAWNSMGTWPDGSPICSTSVESLWTSENWEQPLVQVYSTDVFVFLPQVWCAIRKAP